MPEFGAVVLAVHYQNEVLHARGRIRLGVSDDGPRRAGVVEAAHRLLAGARARSIPVISIRIAFRPDHADVIQNCKIFRDVVTFQAMIDGSWGAEFHEGLGPAEGEFVVKHTRTNAFLFSPLEEHLKCLGARRLIIGGIATNSAVEATARHASDIGYAVCVAADACSASDETLHAASLRNLALVAEVGDVASSLS
jgi:nicotinamidase-related amidase